MCFVPADMEEENEDYGMIILKVITEDGEDLLADVDDESELNHIYDLFMEELFAEEDED